jgi:predicted CopG family antitoxin
MPSITIYIREGVYSTLVADIPKEERNKFCADSIREKLEKKIGRKING